MPWRLLAYLLQLSPDVDRLRSLLGKRLMEAKHIDAAEKDLERMLLTLHAGGFVRLEPEPPKPEIASVKTAEEAAVRSRNAAEVVALVAGIAEGAGSAAGR